MRSRATGRRPRRENKLRMLKHSDQSRSTQHNLSSILARSPSLDGGEGHSNHPAAKHGPKSEPEHTGFAELETKLTSHHIALLFGLSIM